MSTIKNHVQLIVNVGKEPTISSHESGKDSDRQTASVKNTLANALKRISTQRIFMTLSADDVPLNINNEDNSAIISVVNNPKFQR